MNENTLKTEIRQDQHKTKQLTLRLPEESHRKLKILAACTGKSMTEILVCCIDQRLKECLEREMEKVREQEKAYARD
jgi:predicted DNA-binding protein